MASDPATFFIRIFLQTDFQLPEDICFCLDNDKTDERLLTKTEVVPVPDYNDDSKKVMLLISRYPRASTNKWIVANEKEVCNFGDTNTNRKIWLSDALKGVAI
jgi:hypothetical protein